MRCKNFELMNKIINYIDKSYLDNGSIPSMREIASALGMSKSSVCDYIAEMKEKGMIENNGNWRGTKTQNISKLQNNVSYVPLLGRVACGLPIFAEENIEEYLPIPSKILGNGNHFILKAKGDSMINAGINDGDYIIVRQQDTAEIGQIVIALIDDEATLKRYYVDNEKNQIRLHAENQNYQDMFFDNVLIQGIAVKIIKDIE